MIGGNKMSDLRALIDKWSSSELDFDQNDLDPVRMTAILSYGKYRDLKYLNRKIDQQDQKDQENKFYKHFSVFIKKTMDWIHCNPSKPHTVQLSKETFVFSDTDDSVALNTKLGMFNFCKMLVGDDKFQDKYYAIVGPKGSGKTYTQNYFLNQYSKKLFKKQKTWFRIDMTKILKYQSKYGRELSLEQYLNAQIVYIFFRYKDNPNSQDIFSEINMELLEQNVKNIYEKENNDFDYIYENLRNMLKTGKGKTGIYKPLSHPLTSYFAREIIDMIDKMGFSFIVFVDGIDNVDYTYDKNLKRWIREISEEKENDERIFFKAEKIVISCRPETIEIIQYIQREQKYAWNIGRITSFWIEAISPKKILDKFLLLLLNGELDAIPAIMKEYEDQGFDRALLEKGDIFHIQDFYDFGLNFSKYIAKSINDKHGKNFNIKEDKILSKLYHFSLRDLISDILQTYVYIHYYRIQKGIKQESVEKMLKNRQINNHLIFSMSLRHGYLYLRQHSEYAPPFSILHSLDILNPSTVFVKAPLEYMWLGYIFLKKIEYQSFTREEISKECAKIGLTDKGYVKEIKNRFLEHGLIRYIHMTENSDTKLMYEITDRGRFALIGLTDIDMLNISSYKSHYPNRFLEYRLVQPFKKDFSDATTSLVGNVLSILKLLQIGKKKLKTNYIHFDIFSVKVIEQLVSVTKDIELKEFIEIFTNFIDLYGDESLNKGQIGMETLLDMYEKGKITKYDYFKRISQLSLKN